jgi:hypothetical protein
VRPEPFSIERDTRAFCPGFNTADFQP